MTLLPEQGLLVVEPLGISDVAFVNHSTGDRPKMLVIKNQNDSYRARHTVETADVSRVAARGFKLSRSADA